MPPPPNDDDTPSERQPRVLIASLSHGSPPTQPRPQRALELGRHLAERGVRVDHVVLVEEALHPTERRRLEELSGAGGEVALVARPAETGLRGRLRRCFAESLGLLGVRRPWRPPRRWLPELASRLDARTYDLAILCGERLHPLVPPLAERVRLFLDLPRLEFEVRREQQALGREDASGRRREQDACLDDLRASHGILVATRADGETLRRLGVKSPVHVAPPVASFPDAEAVDRWSSRRPPRILFVGSETVANLDGIRWFRHRVLPRVLRAVPSCRLRLVGECARHIQSGPEFERVGWVDDLTPEYLEASVVLLPLRLGGGVRRRAVEALAHGRTLAATETAARGLDLEPGRDAIVDSGEAELAEGIITALTDDESRQRYEARAREIARERFAPERALAPLFELLLAPESTLAVGPAQA
ncbi:MAG: glycosyltransferase [Planctomycetota bacterium]|nr:glycosyltransferase [Planctomycetota bacterium]